jgi:pyruvate,orthophosphate dikinase
MPSARRSDGKFGGQDKPLLVSVRSGARASMPGMMDTVLNLGLNDETVSGAGHDTGDERFAYDSYRRFIQMYGDVVLGLDHEHLRGDPRGREGQARLRSTPSSPLSMAVLSSRATRSCYRGRTRPGLPAGSEVQLWGAIGAVFSSWMNARAVTYRQLHNIPASWGTAVNVQAMVFGNLGETSATGVAFTRNPSTGEKALYGEFLVNAQGEDVVAGIRTPQDITEAARIASGSDRPSMEADAGDLPEFTDIVAPAGSALPRHAGLEFTVEQGKLWMLQTRSGKRTAKAALKIAVDMAERA